MLAIFNNNKSMEVNFLVFIVLVIGVLIWNLCPDVDSIVNILFTKKTEIRSQYS